MSLINVKEINATTINASTGGIKDVAMTMQCTSSGFLTETRLVATSITLSTECAGSVDRLSLIVNPLVIFTGDVKGMLKLVIPINLNILFDNTSDMALLASEIFNYHVSFNGAASGNITKFISKRKDNPSIVFTLYSLQYLNTGRIIINKNKYL